MNEKLKGFLTKADPSDEETKKGDKTEKNNLTLNMILLLLTTYKMRIAELEEEDKKNKAFIALLEGFIDGKKLSGWSD